MVEADDREVSIEEIAPHAKRNCRTCFGKGEIAVWRKAPDGHLVRVESACMCAMRRWAKQTGADGAAGRVGSNGETSSGQGHPLRTNPDRSDNAGPSPESIYVSPETLAKIESEFTP